ncbi:MAG: hypothetical protein JXA28_06435 [Bacteroidetes bacterium]|nr:hypothetical protein [Bacteroidota bacterium]
MTAVPSRKGTGLYTLCAGIGALVFFLGPALALLADVAALPAASVGYAGIMLFTGGIAARYDFATAANRWLQLGKNLLVALAITLAFYLVFLFLYLL